MRLFVYSDRILTLSLLDFNLNVTNFYVNVQGQMAYDE